MGESEKKEGGVPQVLGIQEVDAFLSIWDDLEGREDTANGTNQGWLSMPLDDNREGLGSDDGSNGNALRESTETTGELDAPAGEEKTGASTRSSRMKRNIKDDYSDTTDENFAADFHEDEEDDEGGKHGRDGKNKARKSRVVNTRRIKNDVSLVDPWTLEVCQMPIVLSNAINNGDIVKLAEIVDKYFEQDIVYNDCQYSRDNESNKKEVIRQHGCSSMLEGWRSVLTKNPDFISDLKEVKLKKSDITTNQECVVFKMNITVTLYGPDLRSFQEMMDGKAPQEKASCNIVDSDNVATFAELCEMDGVYLDAAERDRLNKLHADAIKASSDSNGPTDAIPITICKAMVAHCYFNKASKDPNKPYKVISEMFRDMKIRSITRSSLAQASSIKV